MAPGPRARRRHLTVAGQPHPGSAAGVTSEQKTVQYLAEAHALEAALLQTLTAHIAITPRSEYRDLLERHAEETRAQLERIGGRLAELGEGRNPLQLAYGLAQTAVGQLIAAGKFPLDLLRGTGGEEKLLKNAKDEAASEALEIATYDALEALAEAAGDEETATLAREHRAQEEAFLADLRQVIGQLARDVHAAETGNEGAGATSLDAGRAAAVETARAVASEVRSAASKIPVPSAGAPSPPVPEAADEAPADEPATEALPIENYDELTAEQILPKLRLLTASGLARVDEHERAGRGRKRILDRVAKLRSQTNGSQPAAPPR
jgi:ferritin-like metal-binding protein YciE